jgi:hypothetical protein
VYFYKNIKFEAGSPIVLEDNVPAEETDKAKWVTAVAAELEDIVQVVTDADGEQFEKPQFHVEYEAPRPNARAADRAASAKRTRLPVRPLRRNDD